MTGKNGIFWLFIGVFLLTAAAANWELRAEEPSTGFVPFGKEPGSVYLGGTSGLSGLDSIRGLTDSMFYAKWYQQTSLETAYSPDRVIYGDDDRVDVYTVTDPHLLKLAQATCAIVFDHEISDNGDGTWDLSPTAWTTQGGLPLCEDERFVGQQTIGNCSGFLVSEDIVVTAGHCISSCGAWGFLFGYQQTDSLTPPALTVPDDNVYFCSEILAWAYAGDNDYCVVRLDRPVVGRTPIPIRREGVVADGTPLVVSGHPIGLPMKLAAGAEVKDNRGSTPWFQANTDTYGGNSGSMVVNTDSWEIEGILVRGAPDFVYTTCTESNVVPNTGNTGIGLEFEEVSKITEVAHVIPLLVNATGELTLNRSQYSCDDQIEFELADLDLASLGTFSLLVFTSAADSEFVSLTEIPTGTGIFEGAISVEAGTVAKYDGVLQVADGDVATGQYEDANDGTGSPATVEASSTIDCAPPVISDITIVTAAATSVTISFSTDETAQGLVRLGPACGEYTNSEAGSYSTSHEIQIGSLTPLTPYRFVVEAVDWPGNLAEDDNGGLCYEVTTIKGVDFFTETYASGCDVQAKTLVYEPDGSAAFYELCTLDASGFPVGTESFTTLALLDDDFVEIPLTGGNQVSLYGDAYSSIYVGSNGYITFGEGDTDWSETVEEHLAYPPRVSGYWDDLDPAHGGRVSYAELSDRVVVTWEDVPEHLAPNLMSAQVQLMYDGTIAVTYLGIESPDGLTGISAGDGMPEDFAMSDFSAYPGCGFVTCYADTDGDTFGDFEDPGDFDPGSACGPGRSSNRDDCDDLNGIIYPDAPEVLDDAIDQDCDGIDNSCCEGTVGDVNGLGGDIPTIGDVSVIIDNLFISGAAIDCLQEADINQSGGRYPTVDDITIGDISTLIDHLFISGAPLNDCL